MLGDRVALLDDLDAGRPGTPLGLPCGDTGSEPHGRDALLGGGLDDLGLPPVRPVHEHQVHGAGHLAEIGERRHAVDRDTIVADRDDVEAAAPQVVDSGPAPIAPDPMRCRTGCSCRCWRR